ncbi:MAG TPA: 30S ribosomal protein S16 [Anaerolineae bacterium]|nr:30S ribosomal protein S16 [Anaerolineae bacterium]
MVRIRLRRVGARHQPSYRIVAADRESPRDGRFLENLGFYNPRTEPSTVTIDEARLFHWLKHGAQPSDAVVKVLKPHGTWERWERYKGGEDLEALLKEAEGAFPEVDSRTRRDDLFQKRAAKKKPKKKEEASPTISDDVEAEQEIVEAEESAEPSAEEVTAEVAEGETLEQPAEEEPSEGISTEETSEGEAEADEEVEAQAVDEEAEDETSDDEEE